MSNSFLVSRSKLFNTCQIRSLTNSSWIQSLNNIISLDHGGNAANLPRDDVSWKANLVNSTVSPGNLEQTFFDLRNRSSLLQTLDKKCATAPVFPTISKNDILTLLRPIGVQNQELIESLAKKGEQLDSKQTIHVKNTAKDLSQPLKTCNKANWNLFSSFDTFASVDKQVKGDVGKCAHMYAAKTAEKTQMEGLHAKGSNSTSGGKDPSTDKDKEGPTLEQLETVKNYYIEMVPNFHKKGERLLEGFHDKDIVFENNFFKRPRRTVGLNKYAFEMSKLTILASVAYPRYFLEIQQIKTYEKEGFIRMHWRMYHLSNWKFYRHFLSIAKQMMRGDAGRDHYGMVDAISKIYVNKNGQVTLHRVDRITELKDYERSSAKDLAQKLVPKVGLARQVTCNGPKNEKL